MAALLPVPAAEGAGTIVYERGRTDEELDRVRAEIWAMDEDGSNRRRLASTANNADVEKHGSASGYVSYSEPSLPPKGSDVVFKAGAVGHSATACNPFGPLGVGCQVHFGFNVDGVRIWTDGRLRDLTPRPLPCSNCSTFYSHPEQLSGGGWVGWYEHFQGGDTPFSAYVSRWVLGVLRDDEPHFQDSPCPEDFDQGPFAAHPRNPARVAFVACRAGGDGATWSVFVANRNATGVRQVASILVDDEKPALAWTANGRGLIARIFDAAAPASAGLYLLDPRAGPAAQRPAPILAEPAGVRFEFPNPVGARRIAFGVRTGSGEDNTTTDVWAIRAACRGCAFPAAARRLTKDGISASPDWTAVSGLGLAAVRSSGSRVRGRRVPVSISCPAGRRACRGRLVLKAAGKTIARGRYRVPPGKSRRASVRLTAGGRALSARRARLRARAELRGARGERSEGIVELR